ncbi:unnamed protein product (macronuclear) [Paramecium tetraurelia]|uniref:RING-type domain-containing protein n=1 Tax=Paramecium tetraurelia TaxID=5888 RepID=A0DC43_PARTE|nr:uncharacterized protein GSPATT00015487001 [Paramecium tetraurelia]CAK80610.1 unnamed protein product [Paramecium tetraurelia]|eukprot:XP_001448007.1 hypothetical protein (macronuclear) [Paramecium tetraurelia strain d4-2]
MKFKDSQYKLQECSNCKDQYPKCGLVKHMETCGIDNQIIICRYCGEKQLKKLILNHLNVCQAFALVDQEDSQCEFCKDKIFKKFQQEHFRECVVKKMIDKQQAYKPQECSICLMDIQLNDQKGLLQCCHVFHKNCLQQWQKRSKVCPVCRYHQ